MTTAVNPSLYAERDSFIDMPRPAQIRHFETEGYVVLPNVLDPSTIEVIKKELAEKVPMRASFFTDKPAFAKVAPHTRSRSCAALIAHPPVLDFVRALLGD